MKILSKKIVTFKKDEGSSDKLNPAEVKHLLMVIDGITSNIAQIRGLLKNKRYEEAMTMFEGIMMYTKTGISVLK